MKSYKLILVIVVVAMLMTGCFAENKPPETDAFYFEFDAETGTIVKFHSTGIDGNQRLVEYVVVPETIEGVSVKKIGHLAFNYIETLKGVELPSSVESIDSLAFYGNRNLATFVMGDGVKTIGDSAFKECVALKSIKFSSALESIGQDAFIECDGIEFLEFPDGLISIDNRAFALMSGLEYIDFGEGLQVIGEAAFQSSGSFVSGGMPLEFPASLRRIEADAFSGVIITEVVNRSSVLEAAVSENTSYINDLLVDLNTSEQKTGYYYLTLESDEWGWERVDLDQMRTPINLSVVALLVIGVGYILAGIFIVFGKKRMVNASVEIIPFLMIFFVLFIQMGIDPKGSFYFRLSEGRFGVIHTIAVLLIAFLYRKLRHEYNLFKWRDDEVNQLLHEKFKLNKIKFNKFDDKIGNSTKYVFKDDTKLVVTKRLGEVLIQTKSVKGLKPHDIVIETFKHPLASRRKLMLVSTGIKHILIGIFLIYMGGTLL